MHKEKIPAGKLNNGGIGSALRLVLDEEDIEFIKTRGFYLSRDDLADYFGINQSTLSQIFARQPDAHQAYQKSRTQKKLQYHELADKMISGEVTNGNASLLIFQLKTRCRMAEAAPEPVYENMENETTEEREMRLEDTKLFTIWKRERLKQLAGEKK